MCRSVGDHTVAEAAVWRASAQEPYPLAQKANPLAQSLEARAGDRLRGLFQSLPSLALRLPNYQEKSEPKRVTAHSVVSLNLHSESLYIVHSFTD